MNEELLAALERIEREKGISKEVLFKAIESALVSAARKVIEDKDIDKEDITVKIDDKTGEVKVYKKDTEVKSGKFGRIAAQTAKQVIIQKIREAERDVVFDKYSQKAGTIVSGSVHRFEKGSIIVELDDTEAVLPKSEQLPREKFRQGEGLRAYLLKVERESGAPEIILSRADEGFVRKLFELEVPEISQGIIEIKSIAREAGERTKIAVHSKDEKVDPVGACVGMRGARVKDIVRELHGERIDIVRWSDDIREYLKNAISPAEIVKIDIYREQEKMTLYVLQDQLSLVIGKKGRNIRLASKLLGWELTVESLGVREILLSEIGEIDEETRGILEEAGYENAKKVYDAGLEEIAKIEEIDEEAAKNILSACEAILAAVAAEYEAAEAAKAKEEAGEAGEEAKEEAKEEAESDTARAEEESPEGAAEEAKEESESDTARAEEESPEGAAEAEEEKSESDTARAEEESPEEAANEVSEEEETKEEAEEAEEESEKEAEEEAEADKEEESKEE
jgi:N utilization substance protein A